MNIPNTVNLRINTLKASVEQVTESLEEHGITLYEHPTFKGAYYIEGRPRLNHIPSFQEGWFEVQDAGSQSIAPIYNLNLVRLLLMLVLEPEENIAPGNADEQPGSINRHGCRR